jgi:hypothetical protein
VTAVRGGGKVTGSVPNSTHGGTDNALNGARDSVKKAFTLLNDEVAFFEAKAKSFPGADLGDVSKITTELTKLQAVYYEGDVHAAPKNQQDVKSDKKDAKK